MLAAFVLLVGAHGVAYSVNDDAVEGSCLGREGEGLLPRTKAPAVEGVAKTGNSRGQYQVYEVRVPDNADDGEAFEAQLGDKKVWLRVPQSGMDDPSPGGGLMLATVKDAVPVAEMEPAPEAFRKVLSDYGSMRRGAYDKPIDAHWPDAVKGVKSKQHRDGSLEYTVELPAAAAPGTEVKVEVGRTIGKPPGRWKEVPHLITLKKEEAGAETRRVTVKPFSSRRSPKSPTFSSSPVRPEAPEPKAESPPPLREYAERRKQTVAEKRKVPRQPGVSEPKEERSWYRRWF